jgi:hypothetical protein
MKTSDMSEQSSISHKKTKKVHIDTTQQQPKEKGDEPSGIPKHPSQETEHVPSIADLRVQILGMV